jgi:hypothetical protein
MRGFICEALVCEASCYARPHGMRGLICSSLGMRGYARLRDTDER